MPETRPIAAAFSILGAMALIGYIDNLLGVLTETSSLWMFHFMRSLIAVPLLIALAMLVRMRVRPVNWQAVIARSFFITAAMLLYFGALAFLPITQAVAGLFTSPLFVLAITTGILREPVGRLTWFAAPLGFVGVVLVLQPWSDQSSPLAPLAVISGLFYAISAIATRRWCAQESTATLVLGSFIGLGLCGVLGVVILSGLAPSAPVGTDGFLLRGWVAIDSTAMWIILIQAVGSIVAVGLITKAYQIGEAPFVAVFEYTLLMFASVWAFVLFGDVPGSVAVIGISLIFVAGAGLAFAEKGAKA